MPGHAQPWSSEILSNPTLIQTPAVGPGWPDMSRPLEFHFAVNSEVEQTIGFSRLLPSPH